MEFAQSGDIRFEATFIKELTCAGNFRVLLANDLNGNVNIGDVASRRTSDGSSLAWTQEQISLLPRAH